MIFRNPKALNMYIVKYRKEMINLLSQLKTNTVCFYLHILCVHYVCRPVKEDIIQGKAKRIIKSVWNYLVPFDKCKPIIILLSDYV